MQMLSFRVGGGVFLRENVMDKEKFIEFKLELFHEGFVEICK